MLVQTEGIVMTAISLALLLWRDRNYFSFLWIWSGLWLFQLPSMVQGCYGSSRPRLWEDCSFHSGLLELPGRKTNCSAGETTWKGPGLHGEGEGSSWAQSFKHFYRNTRHVVKPSQTLQIETSHQLNNSQWPQSAAQGAEESPNWILSKFLTYKIVVLNH